MKQTAPRSPSLYATPCDAGIPIARRRLLVCGGLAAWSTARTVLAHPAAPANDAAPFPTRPVTLVVPFTPSSGSDTIARIVAPRLAARWKQPVLVDNPPGASGQIGTSFVAKAAPGGHTLLMALNAHAVTPALYKSLPYDTERDFAPITKLASAAFTLAIRPDLAAQNVSGFLALARSQPGKLNYASPGNGTPHHMAMEFLKAQYGVNLAHVPYKGISGAITDLMAGHVDVMFASVPSIRPHAQTGKVRLLAVTGATRSNQMPTTPTFSQQGFGDMDAVDAWYAVLAPAGTPAPLVARLQHDFTNVMQGAEVKAELARLGLVVQTGTPQELAALIHSDLQRWQQVASTAHIRID